MNLRRLGATTLAVLLAGSIIAAANSYTNSNGSVTPGFRIEYDGTGVAVGTSTKPFYVTTPATGGSATSANQTAVQAPLAPAAATATKSLLMGCVYTAAGVTFTNVQQGAAQCDAAGRYLISVGSSLAFAPIAAATATATKSVLLGGQYDSTQKTLTNGQQGAVSVSARGAPFVAVGADGFALTAGSAIIGKVTTDQTTHGTTDLVAADITKVAGSAISQGHGTAATAIRVELPTDGTGVVGLAAGANTIGALTANQSVNVAQINGATALMGNGATGTGSQRVTIANDSSAIAVKGEGATGAAVPSGAVYAGANVGGNLTGNIGCGSSVVYDASTSGSTELVPVSGSTAIYVCGYSIIAGGTVTVKLTQGTGTACATSETAITPAWSLTAQAGLVDGSPYYRGLKAPASKALCLKTNGAVAVQAIVYYSQF